LIVLCLAFGITSHTFIGALMSLQYSMASAVGVFMSYSPLLDDISLAAEGAWPSEQFEQFS
jgi:hypothetical protein